MKRKEKKAKIKKKATNNRTIKINIGIYTYL
jgi:hypothetical protein